MNTFENDPRPPFVVCPDCEGRGAHGPGFVWTQDERDEWDEEEFYDFQRDIRRGQFDVTCEFCKGRRVVTPEDADEYEEHLAYRAEREAERRMGC